MTLASVALPFIRLPPLLLAHAPKADEVVAQPGRVAVSAGAAQVILVVQTTAAAHYVLVFLVGPVGWILVCGPFIAVVRPVVVQTPLREVADHVDAPEG